MKPKQIILVGTDAECSDAEWKAVLGRIEYVLELHAPKFLAVRTTVKDKIRPRQEPAPAIEDLI